MNRFSTPPARCRKWPVAGFIILCAAWGGPLVAETPAFKNVTKATGLKVGTDAACWIDLDNLLTRDSEDEPGAD